MTDWDELFVVLYVAALAVVGVAILVRIVWDAAVTP